MIYDIISFAARHTHSKSSISPNSIYKTKKQKSPYLNIHIGATALHYGQSCFEGLKAFAHDDGSVYLFRPDENAKR